MNPATQLQPLRTLAQAANVPAHLEALFTGYLKSDDCTDHTPAQRANIFETFLTLHQLARSMK